MVVFHYVIPASMVVFGILAQAATEAATPTTGIILTLVNLGLAGIGLLAFVKNWIVSGHTHEKTIDKVDQLEEKIDALNLKIQDAILPSVIVAQTTQNDVVTVLSDFMKLSDKIVQDPTNKSIASNIEDLTKSVDRLVILVDDRRKG